MLASSYTSATPDMPHAKAQRRERIGLVPSPRGEMLDRTTGLVRVQNLNANLIALPCLVPTFNSLRSGGAGLCRAFPQRWQTTCSPMVRFRVLRASSFDDGAVNMSVDKQV